MKLSKKGRYGLRALIDLSVHSKTEHVALYSIAQRNDISPQYLEQVFAGLRRAGIIKGIKGSQGGYLLNGDAKDITVARVLEALEGNYRLEDEALPKEGIGRGTSDTIQKLVIERVNAEVDQVLEHLTLADLEKEYLEQYQEHQDMYYI